MRGATRWSPALVLGLGIALTMSAGDQHSMSLTLPLTETIPSQIATFTGYDVPISEDERQVAGFSDHLLRQYTAPLQANGPSQFTVYLGYYRRQSRGKTIHSPKNCLPGSGWEPLGAQPLEITTSIGRVTVNRYLLVKGEQKALVLYWYQGRGRVRANEYVVKWDLLRDAALRHRTEEALGRIVVPIAGQEERASALATQVAAALIPALDRALPAWP